MFATSPQSWTAQPGLLAEVVAILPYVARAEAAELFFPRAWARVCSPDYAPEQAFEVVDSLRLVFGGSRVATVRKAATLGRNDPCSCGSGKKYKKCCGASA